MSISLYLCPYHSDKETYKGIKESYMSKWEYGLYFVATVDSAGVLKEVVDPAVLKVVDHKEEVEVVDNMKFFLGCYSILAPNFGV